MTDPTRFRDKCHADQVALDKAKLAVSVLTTGFTVTSPPALNQQVLIQIQQTAAQVVLKFLIQP